AFVPEDGDRAIDLLPPQVAAHYRESVAEQGFGWLIPQRPLEVLGVTDPGDVEWLESRFVPHPWRTYTDAVRVTAAGARPDGVALLVYLDAFVPDDGDRAIDLLPPQVAAHYRESVAERGFGWLIPPRPLEVLGVTDPGDVAWLESRFVPHPWRTYTEPVSVTAAGAALPAAFVECTDWLRVFEPFARRAAARGWPVRGLASGHEAMVTHPRELADLLLELAA
ncbi:MAG TPA: hypothetical protein VIU44_14275, partial [Gaiellaceae bacterium]